MLSKSHSGKYKKFNSKDIARLNIYKSSRLCSQFSMIVPFLEISARGQEANDSISPSNWANQGLIEELLSIKPFFKKGFREHFP